MTNKVDVLHQIDIVDDCVNCVKFHLDQFRRTDKLKDLEDANEFLEVAIIHMRKVVDK